jgi:hypothetical protein
MTTVSPSPIRSNPSPAPGRRVDLVVVDGEGHLLGRLPPFDVATPWWQDLEPIIDRHPELVVLRLLRVDGSGDQRHGGRVTYLVEAERAPVGLVGLGSGGDGHVSEEALAALLADHPLRMPWARPGGPASDLAWAQLHVRPTSPPRQVRSWNLSSVWALPTAEGTAWLKCVPPFFAHEAEAIRGLGPSDRLPRIIAAEGSRTLMAQMPGRDGYGAASDDYCAVIDALLELQSATLARPGRLADIIPSWSPTAMARSATEVLQERRAQVATGSGSETVALLDQLLAEWDERWRQVNECGLPDVVFHGDLHPGNARIGVVPPVIFDWGDCGWGHPLLDLGVVSAYHPDPALVAVTLGHWLEGWRRLVPGSDPDQAWVLLHPVSVLRSALVFQNFVDNIEPSERVFHDADVPEALARTAARLVKG